MPVASRSGTGPRLRLALSLGAFLAIAILMVIPVPAAAPAIDGVFGLPLALDKAVHGFLFLIAAPLWLRTAEDLGWRRPMLAAFAFATLYGALLEGVQAAFTPARSAEWGDWLADSLGAIAGLWLVAWIRAIAAGARTRSRRAARG